MRPDPGSGTDAEGIEPGRNHSAAVHAAFFTRIPEEETRPKGRPGGMEWNCGKEGSGGWRTAS